MNLDCFRNWGGAIVITVLGLVLVSLYGRYVLTNDFYLDGPVWLFPIGFVLVLVLAAGLVYGGYWLITGPLRPDPAWRVAMWCFAGLIGALSLTFWPIFYQLAIGVAVEDPLFILLMSAGVGANAGVLIGVSDMRYRRRLEQVEGARETLEFLNRLLRHNVLNAVNVIHGYAGLLDDAPAADETREYTSTIRQRCDQISRLVQNVHVLTRRFASEIEPGTVDLSGMLERELDTLRYTYAESIIDGDLQAGVLVRADEVLTAVVVNLVINAVEHNDRSTPRVHVLLEADRETATVRIADDGPGIPSGHKERVFDPGRHGDRGLGLYLADVLVTEYDGDIRIEDNDPRGTVVVVDLPLATASGPSGTE